MRIYDGRLGRFLSVDPLTKDFPWYTPYQFAGNKPIWAVDLDGEEESVSTMRWYFSDKGALLNTTTSDAYVQPQGTFRVGFRKQTTKEIIAEAFVKSNNLPASGNFLFVEHQLNPGANYASYYYKDASGSLKEAHFDAQYISWMYGQLGIAQENLQKGLNVIGAGANAGGAAALMKTELKALSSEVGAESKAMVNDMEAALSRPLTGPLPSMSGKSASEISLTNLQTSFEQLAKDNLLPKYLKEDPNLIAGYTGSFKTGKVGNPNKATFGQPVDLNQFDIDYWIKSDILFKKYGPNLRADPEFRKLLSEIPGFEGLKPNKQGFSIKFMPSSSKK